jgi:hypothetical protein
VAHYDQAYGEFFVSRRSNRPPMIPVVLEVAAAPAVLLLVSLVTRAAIRYGRRRGDRRKVHRLAQAQPAAPRAPETQARESAVIRDAERALAEARRRGADIVAAAEEQAAEIQAAVEREATRKAEGIVLEAQQRANELRTAAESSAAAGHALAESIRTELTTLLRDMLEEARGSSALQLDNVVPLEGQQEPRARRSDRAQ